MNDSAVAVLTANEILSGLHTVKSVLAPDLTDDELKLFAMVASRSGLDPFAKQVYAVKRKGRVTFQTGIDGYRSIAARTGMYDGQDEPEYGPVCGCGEAPGGHPELATVRVYRKGVSRAIAATAYWHEYKPGDNDFMWTRMPRVMIAKVAEALALRKAFPYDPERRDGIGADVYTADEMAQADAPVRPATPTLAERAAAARAAIDTTTTQEADAAVASSGERTAVPSAPPQPAAVQEAPAEPSPATEAAEAAPGEVAASAPIGRLAFMARIKEQGVTQEAAVGRASVLFPGLSPKDLSDEQRGRLLDDLMEGLTPAELAAL